MLLERAVERGQVGFDQPLKLLLGVGQPRLQDRVECRIRPRALDSAFDRADARLAIAAIERILNESKLAELWDESEDGVSWRSAQGKISERLRRFA